MGAIQQGNAAAAQAEYSAKVARQNAEIDRRKADDASERGRLESEKMKEKGRQFAGAQKAALASQGTWMDTDLACLTDRFCRMTAADDAMTDTNAMLERSGFLSTLPRRRTRARGSEFESSLAKQASFYNAGSTLLTGASSLAKQWDFWKNGY
jgi:hypothetical protein